MATKSRSPRPEADTYMELICRFPLKPLKDDARHEQAVAIIGELMGRKLDAGSSDYLDTLILLVNKYEDEHHTPKGVHLTPQQALKAIMNVNGISQAQVGRIIGSESAVSMFLKGERELSKAHIKALAARFRVDASLFL
ncbi:MAG: type II toxin-antitoxin system HigA family antitoxin [Tepidisphaerales bacterium]